MKRNQWPIIFIVILLGFSVVLTSCGGGNSGPLDQADPVRVDPEPTQAAVQTSAAEQEDPVGSEELTDVDMSYTYMGNANSMKFHLTTCDSAAQTKVSNRVYFDTREEAVKAGYEPCKRCNP